MSQSTSTTAGAASPPPSADDHPFPNGATVFFASGPCPSGWRPILDAVGRFVVGSPIDGGPDDADSLQLYIGIGQAF